MLRLSLGATSYLAGLLAEAEAPREAVIRFIWQRRERRVCLRMDLPTLEDLRWNDGSRTILVCEPAVHKHLAPLELYLQDTLAGPRLVFK